ncbi:MAG: hypothetical protein ACYDH6_14455 [Acidimicrobiales bacterium]
MSLLTVTLGVGVLIRYLFVTSPDQAAVNRAPRIADVAFERAAVNVCQRYSRTFDTETTLSKQPSQAQAGAFLESIASSFDHMVGELRALPVADADRTNVAQWLGDWQTYDAYGHRYAAAVKSGTERDLVAKDKNAVDGLLRTRNAFANANHMGACAFN